MRTRGQDLRMRFVTWAMMRAASAPEGRLPGRRRAKTGLPEAASKMWVG